MRQSRTIPALALVASVATAVVSPALAQIVNPVQAPVRLQPHRAVYDVALDETGPAVSISSISGRVVYELMGSACEGYAQNMRFVTETANTEGEATVTDLRTSSWEDAAARRMRFSSSTYANDQLADQTQGTANKSDAQSKLGDNQRPAAKISGAGPGATQALSIDLTKPERKSARIAEPVYFPIDHSVALIRSAKAGNRVFQGNLYDGSEGGEKFYFTAAVVGAAATQPIPELKPEMTGDIAKLSSVRSWPVSIAYFKPEARRFDQLPLYEMYFRFHENGVTSSLVIDHGDYRLKGELKELTFLEQSPCK